MIVCFPLKCTPGHLNSKGFPRVFLMTQATQKEKQEQKQKQTKTKKKKKEKRKATTSLKANSMKEGHVEYKQDFKNGLQRNLTQVSTAAVC